MQHSLRGPLPPPPCGGWLLCVVVIEIEHETAAVCPMESVMVAVKLKVPAALGVPLITPVAAAILKPVGSAPEVIATVNGGVPPAIPRVCE